MVVAFAVDGSREEGHGSFVSLWHEPTKTK